MARSRFVALLLLALLAACSETRRPLDEDCLKDDDCLSGTCSQLRCAAPPRLLDGSISPVPDGASASPTEPTDAASDGTADSGEAAARDGSARSDAASDR